MKKMGIMIVFLGVIGSSISGGNHSDVSSVLHRLRSEYQAISTMDISKKGPDTGNLLGQSSGFIESMIRYDFALIGTFGGYGSGKNRFNTPSGIVADSQYLYIADKKNNRIVKIDHEFGAWDTIRLTSESATQLDGPENLALIGSNIVVSDSMNHRLVQFRSDGRYVGHIGDLGIVPGHFDTPQGIAQNSLRETVVCDTRNSRIQGFDDRGRFLYDWGQVGIDTETLVAPMDLVILKDDSVAITDAGSQSIKIFSRNGIHLATYFGTKIEDQESMKLDLPVGITVDDRGVLFVADSEGNKVVTVSLDGKVMGIIETSAPQDVVCWGDWVFVTHGGSHTISKYRRTIL